MQNEQSKALNIGLWVLQILAAAAFFMAGGSKLAGAPEMVQVFEKVGMGQWFRYLTGILEVGSAILLVIPALSGLGALILVPVMIGAVITHLAVIGGNPAPAIVLLIFVAIIAWFRQDRTRRLLVR